MRRETVIMEFRKGSQVSCSIDLMNYVSNYRNMYLYDDEEITVDKLSEDDNKIYLTVSVLSSEEQIDIILSELMRGEDVKTTILCV